MKSSRRAILRGVFGSSGFDLSRDTANEVLMRANRSLDPIPLSDAMWAAFVAARRRLRYSEYDRAHSVSGLGVALTAADRAAETVFGHLPPHVARDLKFLLRLDTALRMWSRIRAASTEGTPPAPLRHTMLVAVETDVRHYVRHGEDSGRDQREVIDPVLRCLTQAAAIDMPSPSAQIDDKLDHAP